MTDFHKEKETISNVASRSEKVSWNRKFDNMGKLLIELQPIEEQILDLTVQKQEIFDKIQEIREVMVLECVHPYTDLTVDSSDSLIVCKFCERKFAIQDQ